jgi:hypothetical protein
MAIHDAAELLADCKRLAQRPSTDQQQLDPDWYAFLTDAQEHWYGQFSIHCPWVIMTAPTQMTAGSGNLTYTFGTDADGTNIEPLAVVIFEASDGRILRPGTYWDDAADYVWEGNKIRFPRGAAKTFSSGPYARFITPPAVVSASSEPTLLPKRARKLMVYWAVAEWARRGGIRDPAPFEKKMDDVWFGKPEQPGDVGLLGELKLQNPFGTMEAFEAYPRGILEGVDDGSNYT